MLALHITVGQRLEIAGVAEILLREIGHDGIYRVVLKFRDTQMFRITSGNSASIGQLVVVGQEFDVLIPSNSKLEFGSGRVLTSRYRSRGLKLVCDFPLEVKINRIKDKETSR